MVPAQSAQSGALVRACASASEQLQGLVVAGAVHPDAAKDLASRTSGMAPLSGILLVTALASFAPYAAGVIRAHLARISMALDSSAP